MAPSLLEYDQMNFDARVRLTHCITRDVDTRCYNTRHGFILELIDEVSLNLISQIHTNIRNQVGLNVREWPSWE